MNPLLLAGLVATLLAGCGGDKQEASGPQPFIHPPTARELRVARQQFRTVCSATERAIARAERQEFPGGDSPTTAGIQRFVDEVEVPARQGALESMRRIELPAADRPRIAAYLDAYERAVRTLGADLAVIRDPDIRTTALDLAEGLADEARLARCGTGLLVRAKDDKRRVEIPSGLDPGS